MLNQFAEIPDTIRHKIEFRIADNYGGGGLYYRVNLSEIAEKRITLSYLPATQDDELIVKQYGGEIYNTPPYLINVKPVLRIDGEAKATGAAIGMSQQHEFFMKFITPWGADEVRNNITVGQYLGIGLDVTKVPEKLIKDHLARMETAIKQYESSQDVNIDDLLGELYYTTAMSYFAELDLVSSVSAPYHSIVSSRQPAEAIVGTNLDVSYLFSVPSSTYFTGSYIDVDRNISSICAKDNDPSKKLFFAQMSGFFASTMENIIFEQLYETPAISAVKLISLASQNGIPIYQINSTNIGNTLPQLGVSAEVKSDIQNAINAGKTVTIPQNNLQYYDWIGTGYIITDPETGSGAYMISGGFAGGSTVFKTIRTIAAFVLTFVRNAVAQGLAILITLYDIIASDASGAAKVCALLLLTIALFLAVYTIFVSIPLVAFLALAFVAVLLGLCIYMIIEYGKQDQSKVFKLLQNYFAFLKVNLYVGGNYIPGRAIV